MTRISDLIRAAARVLEDVSDSPRLDAELLLGVVLRKSRTQLLTYGDEPVAPGDEELFGELLGKRLEGRPVAHITGTREFWSIPLKVDTHTLVPRPETELLVEHALLRTTDSSSVLDLGTGSGAIIIAIASERPHARYTAIEQSAEALAIAKHNGACVEASINWLQGSWFEPVAGERFDVIVSNPPYIGTDETGVIDPELKYEPKDALYSGRDGLDAIREIVAKAPEHLNNAGWLLFEHGYGQGEASREILAAHGFVEISTICDLAGLPRISSGRLPDLQH